MSIEQTLERIATALEAIANIQKQPAPSIEPVKAAPASEPVKSATTSNTKIAKAIKAQPVEEPTEATEGMFGPEEATPVTQHTDQSILADLKKLAKATNADVAKGLMVKYGAAPAGPKVADIPAANYPALYAETIKLTPKGK